MEKGHTLCISMTMDAQNNLGHLRDQIQDFLYAAIVRAIHQAAEMEAAMKLHQKRMKDVCYQIKAHYLWENFEQFFPSTFSHHCWLCGETVSPEFDLSRHWGRCELKERLADEASDGPSAYESFYSCRYPYSSRSSYSGPPRD